MHILGMLLNVFGDIVGDIVGMVLGKVLGVGMGLGTVLGQMPCMDLLRGQCFETASSLATSGSMMSCLVPILALWLLLGALVGETCPHGAPCTPVLGTLGWYLPGPGD